ncbi:MAG: class I SAM-dependent methyltransferase [Coleofasciculaceae cyanobacterium]
MSVNINCTHKIIYGAINQSVFAFVPQSAKRILDIGCGSGILGRRIKQNINCEIVGVTYSESEATLASKYLDKVLVNDLNSFNSHQLGQFDCIICSHILEHLYQPQELLKQLNNNLTSEGVLIVALPNVLHWKQRLEFLKGNFKYTDGGLMDKTHFRFFDWDTSLTLIENSGFKVTSRSSDGYFPLPLIRKIIQPVAFSLDKLATKTMPGLFGTQFIIVAQTA